MRINKRGLGGALGAAGLGAADRVPKSSAGGRGALSRLAAAPTDKRRQVMIHIGTSAATFLLAVVDSNGADYKGYIHHIYTDTRIAFLSLFEAATYMNKVADALDYPQRGYAIRSWRDAPNPLAGYGDEERVFGRYGAVRTNDGAPEAEDADPASPPSRSEARPGVDDEYAALLNAKPFFTVTARIQYRQNASWQGEAQWDGASAPLRFRSVFELMCLIAEADKIAKAQNMVLQTDLP